MANNIAVLKETRNKKAEELIECPKTYDVIKIKKTRLNKEDVKIWLKISRADALRLFYHDGHGKCLECEKCRL